jgi:membrane fusion protein, copper/silver efflux system
MMDKLPGGRRRTLSWAASGAAFVLLLLFIQDARHGWPFSRHHAQPAASSRAGIAPSDGKPVDAPRSSVSLDRNRAEQFGISLEPVRMERISASARHSAVVVPDEGRITHVHTRISGWVEKLHVNSIGQSVRAGQPVAQIFSQELLASQNEYLAALRQSRAMPGSALLDAARARLTVLGLSPAQIRELERSGSPQRLVTIFASHRGIVLDRGVSEGTAVDPSTELMTIADLSKVWVLAEVPEADSAPIRIGTPATLTFASSGREPFTAKVDFIYPTLSERTRTLRVRFVADNPDSALRPGLYGTASFAATGREALTIPRDALVDTGNSQHVFVRAASGMLEPRPVRIGARLDDRIEVIEGLSPGDTVVAAGVFLVDSESRLRASSGSAGHIGHGDTSVTPAAEHEPHER